MAPHLDPAGWRLVVVTGPQRSGTTFAARAFAHDLGWNYIDEEAFEVHDRKRWAGLLHNTHHAVIQCPTMMRYVHDDAPDDVLVVVMRRDIDAIEASEQRIAWTEHRRELERYGLTEGRPAEVKYAWWDAHKTDAPKQWVEVDYESMADHPLWVPAADRRQFEAKQTARRG